MNNLLGKNPDLMSVAPILPKPEKNVKGILNWNSFGSPSKLFYKGSLRTKSQDIADSQNEFFIEKNRQIIENLPQPVADPLSKLRSLMLGRQCILTIWPSSSPTWAILDTSIIKLIKNEILTAVTHIINLSIESRKFPSTWKKSKIVPLHKKRWSVKPQKLSPGCYCANHRKTCLQSTNYIFNWK